MLHRRVSITATTGAVGRPELSLTERRVEIFDRGSHFVEVRTRDIVSGHALSNARNVIQRVTERQLLSEIGVGQETNRRLDCRQLSRWPADWSSASVPRKKCRVNAQHVLFAIEQSRDGCKLHVAYCGLYVRRGLRR